MGSSPRFSLLALAALAAVSPAIAQVADNAPRIVRSISNADTRPLAGNRRPETLREQDAGAVAPDLTMRGMMLELSRTPAQEQALATLMAQQLDRASPNFHHWLTPDEFGAQFGPAQADLDTITAWLASQGLTVDKVARGRMVIQFSGPAASVSAAFHTPIHRYLGTTKQDSSTQAEHYANAADPQIPAALAPVIAGVSNLHNYLPPPLSHIVGRFSRDRITGQVTKIEPTTQAGAATHPQASAKSKSSPIPESVQGGDGVPGTFYPLGPADFAVEYNVQKLWDEGIDGTGQTIAIVGVGLPNLDDARNFRALFGLPPKDPVLTEIDPNTTGGPLDNIESDLDVQWAGAVARNAQILYFGSYISQEVSALYIVDNDAAPVMSESFGLAEAIVGNAGNLFYYNLWQQAAAEGISAFVATGDGGSAMDDDRDDSYIYAQHGLAVSGFSSSPFNVSVGGLDFDDEENWTQYWNSVPDPVTQRSMISYIPEVPWNESCASVSQAECNAAAPSREYDLLYDVTGRGFEISGGSGGASNCATQDVNGSCIAGFPQPAWQTGVGVPGAGQPGAGARMQPDISLFASGGMNRTFVVICSSAIQQYLSLDPGCSLADNRYDFFATGGTSFATPAMAGVMALLDQKIGEAQGNPNPAFYAMAARQNPAQCNSSTGPDSNCVFNDITKGNISQPCVANSPDCSSIDPSLIGVLSGWYTNEGYDLATGLGSVNAYNLVHQWSGAAPTPLIPTQTKLSVTPTTAVHGTPLHFSVSVTPASGSGTPTGEVLGPIPDTLNYELSISIGPLNTLANGSAEYPIDDLPGGAQTAAVNYLGDNTYKVSASNSVSITVTPENSTTVQTGEFINSNTVSSLAAVPYGSPFGIDTQTAGLSGVGIPTGTIQVFENGISVGVEQLDPNGASFASPASASLGIHTYTTMYSGDASFNPGPGPSFNATIVQGTSPVSVDFPYPEDPNNVPAKTPFEIDVDVQGTGNVQLLDGVTSLGTAQISNGYAGFFPSFAQTGVHNLTANYSGDSNYLPSSGTSTLTVKLGPVITWNPPPIHYGDILTTAEFQISAKDIYGNLLPGAVSYSFPYPGTQFQAVEVPSFEVYATFAPTDPTYATLTISATMSVLPAAAIIKWPAPAAIQYGTPLTGTQLDASATGVFGEGLTGSFVYAPQSGAMLPAGADPLAAQFTPTSSDYAPTPASTSLKVLQARPSVALNSPALNVGTGVSVHFTAQVTSQVSTPTGQVEFLDGVNSIGIVPLNAAGAASLTTLFSTVATHSITALYLGDSNFTSNTSPVVDVAAVTPGYTISSNPPALSIKQGTQGTATLTLTPVGNFTGTLSFTCSNLPAFATCQFSPATVTFAGNNAVETTQLSLLTTAVAIAETQKATTMLAVLLLLPPFFWPGLLARNRRRRWLGRVPMLVLLAVGAVGISSCGGGGAPLTPAGMDTIQIQATVNGSSGSSTTTLSQTLLLSVTITQ